MGMVQHEPLDHIFAKIDDLFFSGGYHHAIHGIDHTAHLYPFEGTLQAFYRTHPARTHRPEGRMIAEPRDHDAQLFGSLDNFCPRRDFYFLLIDNQFRHEKPLICC